MPLSLVLRTIDLLCDRTVLALPFRPLGSQLGPLHPKDGVLITKGLLLRDGFCHRVIERLALRAQGAQLLGKLTPLAFARQHASLPPALAHATGHSTARSHLFALRCHNLVAARDLPQHPARHGQVLTDNRTAQKILGHRTQARFTLHQVTRHADNACYLGHANGLAYTKRVQRQKCRSTALRTF